MKIFSEEKVNSFITDISDIIIKELERKQIEAVSDYVHGMWSNWFLYFIKNFWKPSNLIRWYKQSKTPYRELSNEDKEKDRKFAYEIVRMIRKIDYEDKKIINRNYKNEKL